MDQLTEKSPEEIQLISVTVGSAPFFQTWAKTIIDKIALITKNETVTAWASKSAVFLSKIREKNPAIMKENNGKKITLQLDHIDGDNNNNKLENLRFLCPNCHSQTETHSVKK